MLRRKVNILVKQDDAYRHLFKDAGPALADIQDNDWQDTRPHWEYPLLREVSNVYSFGKDGKVYCSNPQPERLRK
ncbi:hypothetical protein GCM10011378_41870 [Hymenobacter glacieicola]|uniref:Uncharacterized protein n=1 Tax=Hymenobacter glacieicola TaxID=1562124 RepID=A0ABQ1X5W9_9BACT|nr:hypothetical protein GCM10011378_41870 [Hymenobacter glacieicola]